MTDYKIGDLSSLFGLTNHDNTNATANADNNLATTATTSAVNALTTLLQPVQRIGNIDNRPKKRKSDDNDNNNKQSTINNNTTTTTTKPTTTRHIHTDSDDDVNIYERNKAKKQKLYNPNTDDRLYRTLFLGNVNVNTTKSQIKQFLQQSNSNTQVESIRLRSLPTNNPKLPRKVVAITKSFHQHNDSMNVYVVLSDNMCNDKNQFNELINKYINDLNTKILNDHHIRVDSAMKNTTNNNDKNNNKNDKSQYNIQHTIFVGNLNITTTEEQLYDFFKSCGRIINVRIIRDKQYNISKGIAYVEFDRLDAVKIALALHGSLCNERDIRVSKCFNDKQIEKYKQIRANQPNDKQSNKPVQQIHITPVQRRLLHTGKLQMNDIMNSNSATSYMGHTVSHKDQKTRLKQIKERQERRKAKKIAKKAGKKIK